MNALQSQFVQEARELLEGIGSALLQFERNPADTENLNNLFRLVHTLKGNTGLFEELRPLTRVLHAAEDAMDELREGRRQFTLSDSDLLLDCLDLVSGALDHWEQGQYTEDSIAKRSDALAAGIRASGHALATPADSNGSAPTPPNNDSTGEAQPAWVKAVLMQVGEVLQPLVLAKYTPEPECFFKGEDPVQLASTVPGLQYFRIKATGSPHDDVYQCHLEIVLSSTAPLHEVKRVFECVPEQLDTRVLEPAEQPALDSTRRMMAQRIWTAQATMLALGGLEAGWQARAQAAAQSVSGLASSLGRPAWHTQVQEALRLSMAEDDLQPMLNCLGTLPAELNDGQDIPLVNGPALALNPTTTTAATTAATTNAADSNAAEPDRHNNTMLKVSREKVDRLMELIGEMVVAKNALPYLADKAEQQFGVRELARELKAHYGVINRIAEDMQDAIMQVRMLPVGSVFQRFPRLVRDLSRKLGKKVRLDISGEDTEADKNMIEALSEPLIHVLRNSLDHGVEPPEDRLAAGKSEEGLISISAWQEGDRVHIRVADDGAGIDPHRVKLKALERGLLPAERLEAMTEAELQQLVFMPGFSTARTVSDVSGRGVGMDVVRSAIARVNGQMTLRSDYGLGTELVLSLPLTMAVSNVMMVRADQQIFGVPMDVVVETVRVPKASVHAIQSQRATVLRGKVIPLFDLHALLGLDSEPVLNEEGELAVLVVRAGDSTVGVVVDDFESTVDILLRPLEGVLADLNQYSGSALLGDGTVLLILNFAEVLACQSH
ncbi:MAG: chemotaxis protein CheW [Limnobacter sp.]|uniref:chemotaxis protein CheW n=1 Tax=Limnobacter sp. TaxID=2003368 RepID=UPI00391AE00A